MGTDAMIFISWMLSLKPTFSLSSFAFIKRLFILFFFFKRLFSSSLLSAISVVSFAYLRLLLFLLAILIPACASFSPAFHMMYSAYKLNKQGDNIQPWCTFGFNPPQFLFGSFVWRTLQACWWAKLQPLPLHMLSKPHLILTTSLL